MALDLVNTIMMPDLVIRVQSLAKVEEVISSVQMGRLLDLASTTLKIYGLVKVAALVHTIQETNSIVQKDLSLTKTILVQVNTAMELVVMGLLTQWDRN